MKRTLLIITVLLTILKVSSAKDIFTYTLKQIEPNPFFDKFFYPGSSYAYNIEAFDFRNKYRDFRLVLNLSNGKFENGKTYLNASYDSIRSFNGIKVKWDDIVLASDKAATGKIYVSKITLDPTDTAKVTLKPTIGQISAKIASLKGKIPLFVAGPNQPLGTKNEIIAEVSQDMYYPLDIADTTPYSRI